jgi:hypothetical protein
MKEFGAIGKQLGQAYHVKIAIALRKLQDSRTVWYLTSTQHRNETCACIGATAPETMEVGHQFLCAHIGWLCACLALFGRPKQS